MTPTMSMIAVTTSAGLGYGMLAMLAFGGLTGLFPTTHGVGALGLGLSLALITGGLFVVFQQLSHPKRAWLVFTQWRSSWQSREALAAALTCLTTLVVALGWIIFETVTGIFSVFTLAVVLGAVSTVYCTGMKYASLRPVRMWHHPLTAPIFLGFAIMTGSLAGYFLLSLFGHGKLPMGLIALFATIIAFGLKLTAWRQISAKRQTTSFQTATGLRHEGPVHLLHQPKTQTHQLFGDIGFAIGRKHAGRLRILALVFGLFGSMALLLLSLLMGGWLSPFSAFLALVSGMIGVLTERWLFFAEAEHSSALYAARRAETTTVKKPEKQPKKQKKKKVVEPARPQRRPVSATASGDMHPTPRRHRAKRQPRPIGQLQKTKTPV